MKFKDISLKVTTAKGSPGLPNSSFQQSFVSGYGKQNISSLNLSLGIGLKL